MVPAFWCLRIIQTLFFPAPSNLSCLVHFTFGSPTCNTVSFGAIVDSSLEAAHWYHLLNLLLSNLYVMDSCVLRVYIYIYIYGVVSFLAYSYNFENFDLFSSWDLVLLFCAGSVLNLFQFCELGGVCFAWFLSRQQKIELTFMERSDTSWTYMYGKHFQDLKLLFILIIFSGF